MLDISLGDGGTVCCPLEPANAFRPAPTEHIPATPCASRVSRSQLHLTCTHSAVGLVSSHASFPICASFLPHDLPTIVCLVPAHQQWPNFQSQLSIFSSACGALVIGFFFRLRRAWARDFWAAFFGRRILLHDSSRPARRTAKAWRLRPARGTAPRVSGSRQSVLHERQGNAAGAAAVTTAAAAAAGRRVQHIAGGRAVQVRPLHLPRSDTGRSSARSTPRFWASGSLLSCALKI
jgi:hypothetical protein